MLQSKKGMLCLVALASFIASVFFASGPLGNVSQALARHVLAAGVSATDYPVPAGYDPWGTTADSTGHIWVALPGCDPQPVTCTTNAPGKIAEFNPITLSWVAVYSLPSGYTQPFFLKFDQGGKLWFTMSTGNSIGMYDPAANTFQQWQVPTPTACPWDLAIDSRNFIWFTEFCANKIGRFNPVNHGFREFATPTPNSHPYGIVIDAAQNKWITENNSSVAQIGRYTSWGAWREYKIRNTVYGGLTPHLITVDPNGNVWWSEGFVGRIGELKVALARHGTNQGVTEYAYPEPCQCGAHTSGIAVDNTGAIWFDDSLEGIFGSFPDSGTGSFNVYNAPSGAPGHPHDGLMIDASNRIWFDEEFANKLALAGM